MCIFLARIAIKVPEITSEFAYVLYGILIVLYLSAIPFFIALYQAFKRLTYIDKSQSFSEVSVKALKVIKFCAITISGFYVAGMSFIYIFEDVDDAPGVILIGMLFIFASIVIAVFAAVLQRLLQEAINIKSENDLTV